MSGAITLLLLYTFMSWTRTNLPLLSLGNVSETVETTLSGYSARRIIRTLYRGELNNRPDLKLQHRLLQERNSKVSMLVLTRQP